MHAPDLDSSASLSLTAFYLAMVAPLAIGLATMVRWLHAGEVSPDNVLGIVMIAVIGGAAGLVMLGGLLRQLRAWAVVWGL